MTTSIEGISGYFNQSSPSEFHCTSVAFSRTGDQATGDFGDAKVIRKFGDVPNDLKCVVKIDAAMTARLIA